MNHRLYHNEDCTEFFYRNTVTDGRAGALLDAWVDTMAAAGVTDYLINTNARRTNYSSDVWESFWDGYDPDGPDDQPFLASLSADDGARYRSMVESMLAVHRQGIDYPDYVIERCRRRGMTPWISLRMNDCHCPDNMRHPLHGTFWREHPEFYTQGLPEYFKRCLDYTFEPVRDLFMALIDETLDRYDIDGLELDFMREPYLFGQGNETRGAAILTDWLRTVRQRVAETAARRGHPIRLGVRTPSRPETATAMGLDVATWIDGRLVDLLVFTPRFSSLEFDMPVRQWRELVAPASGIVLAGGLEAHYMPRPWSRHDHPEKVSPELARGAATLVLYQGANAVYLFNYFQTRIGHPGWEPPIYRQTLKAMASLDTLLNLPRRIGIAHRDMLAPGETYRPPLPATGNDLAFEMKLGPLPEPDWHCRLYVGLAPESSDADPADLPRATVDDHACAPGACDPAASTDRIRFFVFDVPIEALKPADAHVIRIVSPKAAPLTVMQLEIEFSPP